MGYPSFIQSIGIDTNVLLNDPLQLSIALLTAIVIIVLLLYALTRSLQSGENLKYEFVTIIAHKFRTPLSRIKWSLDALVSAENDPYKKNNLLEIQQSNENLIKLTATLIDLTDSRDASKTSYHFETIDLCEIVYEKGEALKEAFHEKNLYFSVQCSDGDTFVRADRTRIEFVIQTIMENAFTYSPPGRNIEMTVSPKGRKVLLSVTDYGIGIKRSDLKHIFSKFFRATNAKRTDTEGFGVGLFLSKSVVTRHHGKIKAYSEGLGKGATFILALPRVKMKKKNT